jgi:hypothetical protein
MSQSITYKTKYKSLNSLKKVLDGLAAQGALGEDVEVVAKGEPGFNTGLFRETGNDEVIFTVRDKSADPKMFKRDGGFYERGFAIARDKQTGDIKIIYDFQYGSDAEKKTKAVREKIERMIEAGDTLNKTVTNLKDKMKNMKVTKNGEEEWTIEGEFTPEQLKNILGKLGK